MNAGARRPEDRGGHNSNRAASAGRLGGAFIVELEIFTVKAGRDVARLAASLQLPVVRLQHAALDLLAARRVDRVRDVRVQLQPPAVVAVPVAVAIPMP